MLNKFNTIKTLKEKTKCDTNINGAQEVVKYSAEQDMFPYYAAALKKIFNENSQFDVFKLENELLLNEEALKIAAYENANLKKKLISKS